MAGMRVMAADSVRGMQLLGRSWRRAALHRNGLWLLCLSSLLLLARLKLGWIEASSPSRQECSALPSSAFIRCQQVRWPLLPQRQGGARQADDRRRGLGPVVPSTAATTRIQRGAAGLPGMPPLDAAAAADIEARKASIFSFQALIKEQDEKIRKAKLLQQALDEAARVPSSIGDAIEVAWNASEFAAKAGARWQIMQMSATEDVMESLEFAQQLAVRIAADVAEADSEAKIHILVPGEEAVDVCLENWGDDLPETIDIMAIPEVDEDDAELGPEAEALTDGGVVIVVSPEEMDLPGLQALQQVWNPSAFSEEDEAAEGPIEGAPLVVILLNPVLEADVYKPMLGMDEPETVFFMQNLPPPPGSNDFNGAVVVRTWPRRYAVWEDSPTDPAAIKGFLLLGLHDTLPSKTMISTLLADSSRRYANRRIGKGAER